MSYIKKRNVKKIMNINELKSKIKDLLKEKKMSIYEVSKKAQVSPACIRNWYNKRNYSPSLDVLIRICGVLNISLAQLFASDDEEVCVLDKNAKRFITKFNLLNETEKNAVIVHVESYNKE